MKELILWMNVEWVFSHRMIDSSLLEGVYLELCYWDIHEWCRCVVFKQSIVIDSLSFPWRERRMIENLMMIGELFWRMSWLMMNMRRHCECGMWIMAVMIIGVEWVSWNVSKLWLEIDRMICWIEWHSQMRLMKQWIIGEWMMWSWIMWWWLR